MADADELVLDIEKQSIRGRACPRCGGKIIPSDRAIYQSAGAASDIFPLWQCERCGYSELSTKAPEAPKHGKPAPVGKESAATAATPVAAPPAAAHLRDVKGRPLPRDVQMVLERMPRQQQQKNS
jgi:ribosomal protein S27AE